MTVNSRLRLRLRVAAAGACLGACAAMVLLPAVRTDRQYVSSDWTAFATGAALASGPHPALLYDRAAQQAAQDAITGGGSFTLKGQGRLLPFLSPPWVALFSAPFRAAGFGWGGRLFTLLEVAALALGTLAATRRDVRAAALVAGSFPTLAMVLNAQLDGLVVLGLGLALALTRRGHGFAAGAALGPALVKPHLVLPVAAALVASRRWRTVAGWAAAGLVLVAVSSLPDPAWLLDWVHATAATVGRNGRELDPGTWAWLVPAGPGVDSALTAAATCVTLAVVLAVAGLALRRPSGGADRAAAALIAGGVLVAPHALPSDLVLVAFALAVAGERRAGPWLALSAGSLAASVVPDPWPAAVTLTLVGGLLARLAYQGASPNASANRVANSSRV